MTAPEEFGEQELVVRSDASSRALRTFAQNLAFDVAFAVTVAVLPLVSAEHIDWQWVLVSMGRTAIATAVSFLHRTLDGLRTKKIEA